MDACLTVDEEEYGVGLGDRRVGLLPNGTIQRLIAALDHTSCIDQEEVLTRPVGLTEVPISGDTRLVIDDGHAPTHHPVEEGGLSHVRSAHHGHDRHAPTHP